MLLKTLLSFSTIGLTLGAGTTSAALLKSQNNNPKVAKFDGHFPGLGPYGTEGDQDHAWASDTDDGDIHIKFDLSRTSEQYINDHYLAGRGDTPWYGIYDFETDAYPATEHTGHAIFTDDFYQLKENGDINKMMKDLSDWIGYTDSHHDRLQLNPAYFEATMTTTWYASLHFHWSWGYNRPF